MTQDANSFVMEQKDSNKVFLKIYRAPVAEGLGDRLSEYVLEFKPGSRLSFSTRKIGYRSEESLNKLTYESLY